MSDGSPVKKVGKRKGRPRGSTRRPTKTTAPVQLFEANAKKPKRKKLPVRHGAGKKELPKDPSMVYKTNNKCSRVLADSDSSTSFTELRKEISCSTEEWQMQHNPRKLQNEQQKQTTETQPQNAIDDRGFNSLISKPILDSDAPSFDSSSYFSKSDHHTCSEDDSFVSAEYESIDNSDYGWMLPNDKCNVVDGNKEELYQAIILCAPYRKKMYRHSPAHCADSCICFRWYVRVKFIILGKREEVDCSTVTKLQDTAVGCRNKKTATTQFEILEDRCETIYHQKYGGNIHELERGFGIAIKMVFTMIRLYHGSFVVEEMGVSKLLRDIILANIPHMSDDNSVKFGATDDVDSDCKLYGYNGMISAVAAEKCMRMWFPERNFSIFPFIDENKTIRDIIYHPIADRDSITICQTVMNRLSSGYSEELDANHPARVRKISYTVNNEGTGFGEDVHDQNYHSVIIVRNKYRHDQSKGGSIYCSAQYHPVTGELVARPLWWLNLEKKLGEICSWSYAKKITSCFVVKQRYFLSTYQHFPGNYHEGFGVSVYCRAFLGKKGNSKSNETKDAVASEPVAAAGDKLPRSEKTCESDSAGVGILPGGLESMAAAAGGKLPSSEKTCESESDFAGASKSSAAGVCCKSQSDSVVECGDDKLVEEHNRDACDTASRKVSGTETLVDSRSPLGGNEPDQTDKSLKSIRVTLSPTYSLAREMIPGENFLLDNILTNTHCIVL